MDGSLWLLLQTLPLLAASAAVFFFLGWYSKGRANSSTLGLAALSHAPQPEDQRSKPAAALANVPSSTRECDQPTESLMDELKEAQARQTQLQKEILRLADALEEARASATAAEQENSEALAALAAERQAFENEKAAWTTAKAPPMDAPNKELATAPAKKKRSGKSRK